MTATETLTLSAFLLAAIADDEAVARREKPSTSGILFPPLQPGQTDLGAIAARVLAQCEAHRRIVERLSAVIGDEPPTSTLDEDGWELLAWETLHDLARVYADRPGWQEAWR